MQSLLMVLEDTKIWLCYLLYSLVAWLQNNDYTQFKLVMQSILMGHQGDVHPLKRSVKAHLLNNVLGKVECHAINPIASLALRSLRASMILVHEMNAKEDITIGCERA